MYLGVTIHLPFKFIISPEKTNDDMKCGKCGKELDKFSAANGIRFCNDECLNEFFA